MKATESCKRYTVEQLVAMQEEITSNPDNRNPPGSFNRYTLKARKKLEELSWAITYRMRMDREANKQDVESVEDV